VSRRQRADFDARSEAGSFGAVAEFLQHLRLDVDSDDLSVRTDERRERQREKAHAGAGLEHRHGLVNVGRE
jgi:hypothetical protein